ncbi:hypothetical protein NRB16_24620 [Pseudomonas sp. LJDD11]|uniref:hypothetical protein n=1 Tax=unclassified Pseudomonas TaxID=196821 RepID=UPI0020970E15|nr:MULTISPECIES: hypothetical protein [unclassified Pseudomonas]MCO8160948.1 hypothetical protein [Pseudomonas sp. 21LCFQ010]MCQ9426709.1 hypothetical protein [Pseudomonas sp. LJDD11]
MNFTLHNYDVWKTGSPENSGCAEQHDRWIQNAAEQLVRFGADVRFQRPGRRPQSMTFEQFAMAVDEYAMERLGKTGASPSALGRMVIGSLINDRGLCRDGVSDALGVGNPVGELYRIAEDLLRPLARDGWLAEQEDNRL